MWQVILALFFLSLAGVSTLYVHLRRRHAQARRQDVEATWPSINQWIEDLKINALSKAELPDFSAHIGTVQNFLPAATLEVLRGSALAQEKIDQSLIPGHKKGNTVAYDYLRLHAPQVVAFYQSPQLRSMLSRLIEVDVKSTPPSDQSSCSLLIYREPGDHIGWHYDYNFYKGRHFTVLLSLENLRINDAEKLSSALLQIKKKGEVMTVPTPANTLVVFEGQKVLHRATRLAENEHRMILSMTFCTDDATSPLLDLSRRIKDTAFFGLRALWT